MQRDQTSTMSDEEIARSVAASLTGKNPFYVGALERIGGD